MIVYHGSYGEIKQIDLSKCEPYRDFGFDEKTATDKFFSSNTFSKLVDTSNKLYEKGWTEIYNLLLNELKL